MSLEQSTIELLERIRQKARHQRRNYAISKSKKVQCPVVPKKAPEVQGRLPYAD